MNKIELLDTVALSVARPEHDLVAGQVGTVVETLAQGVFEVEFCDDQGRTYASMAIPATQLIALRFSPAQAA
jgi:hypothetical protein